MINIIYSMQDAWILRRMGEYLAAHIPDARGVDCRDKDAIHDPAAELNFFCNDFCMAQSGPSRTAKNVVFLDHPKGERYLKQADAIICMTPQYERWAKRVIKKPTYYIQQPTDRAAYYPRLRVGFVGRFSGEVDYGDRKGRDLLGKVQELPWFDVICTMGAMPEADMPAFYRRMDAVIVTSKVEGGPMCLTEGLACGKPVIIPPDVGIAELFREHIIPYKQGDFKSLKAALWGLFEPMKRRADAVGDHDWNRWAEQHQRVFSKIIGRENMEAKRTCMYTTAIGPYGDELGAISIPLMQRWAANLGWDFHCFREQTWHKTPSWVRLDIGAHMRDHGYARGCYIDLDAVVDPSAPDPFDEMPVDGWDVAAWNHGDADGWDTQMARRNIRDYCIDAHQPQPTGYDGTEYFNAGVMLFSGRYPEWNPGWRESSRGCQDQNALNLAVIRGELRWARLPRRWNHCHVREIVPDIFDRAHIVHCNQPEIAPCQRSPKRTDLMRQAAAMLTGAPVETEPEIETARKRYGRR